MSLAVVSKERGCNSLVESGSAQMAYSTGGRVSTIKVLSPSEFRLPRMSANAWNHCQQSSISAP